MADEQFDLVKIRTVVLGISTVWMTVDDIQKEITAMRERAGEKPAHVPIPMHQASMPLRKNSPVTATIPVPPSPESASTRPV